MRGSRSEGGLMRRLLELTSGAGSQVSQCQPWRIGFCAGTGSRKRAPILRACPFLIVASENAALLIFEASGSALHLVADKVGPNELNHSRVVVAIG